MPAARSVCASSPPSSTSSAATVRSVTRGRPVTRIGVLGSAFNPPHLGHMALAQEAAWRLELETVILVPTGRPVHKQLDPEPGRRVRLRMTELAAEADGRFEVSGFEVNRDQPSYMVETLRHLGGGRPGAELFLILGADAAAGLPGWYEAGIIPELARLAVAEREGSDFAAAREAVRRLDAEDRLSRIDLPPFAVTSSLVRDRAAAGLPLRYLVPDPVAELIESQRIYGGGGADHV